MNNADVWGGVWRIKDLFWHLIVRSGGDKFTTLEPFISSGFSRLFRVFAYWEELERGKAWFLVSLQSMSCANAKFFHAFSYEREKHACARTLKLECASKSDL